MSLTDSGSATHCCTRGEAKEERHSRRALAGVTMSSDLTSFVVLGDPPERDFQCQCLSCLYLPAGSLRVSALFRHTRQQSVMLLTWLRGMGERSSRPLEPLGGRSRTP